MRRRIRSAADDHLDFFGVIALMDSLPLPQPGKLLLASNDRDR